ncbi:MAG: glycoside hydrolase family 65 protein [Lachnospiraceae bacterium]|nr:glycoside hydrolase family 65 protein [Lachnospiraceae bacterium]
MIDWKIKDNLYNPDNVAWHGNKFLTGNGYMGVRGTLEEYTKEQLVAVNLAGMYDKVGDGWREPVNAPNGFYGYLVVDDEIVKLQDNAEGVDCEEHYIELDYRHGVFTRCTTFRVFRGNITLKSSRFVSMDNVHAGAIKTEICADFHADVKYVFGIDADVWDINGPHFDIIKVNNDGLLTVDAVTHEKNYNVSVAEEVKSDFPCEIKDEEELNKALKSVSFITDVNKVYEIERFFAVYTSLDCDRPIEKAKEDTARIAEAGFDKLLDKHKEAWEKLWKYSEVIIEGDDKSMEALNYSLYHLHSIAPRHADNLSIAARGLSGQTYKGAVFWDTEMFILDFFLMTEPEVAKKLIKYRIDTLEGAKKKAAEYGYDGAFYAWESQEGGVDACSDYNVTDVFTKRPMRTYFKDKQIHISSAIAYAIGKYTHMTGDDSLLTEGGAETIIECAKFYYSALIKKVNSDRYELRDVIGPDEYHERVDNNGYTNRMAKNTFRLAIEVLENEKYTSHSCKSGEQIDWLNNENVREQLLTQFKDAFDKIYIPKPDSDGIIPQFDGYESLEDVTVEEVRSRLLDPKEYWGGAYGVASHTKVIKQADVVTWLAMYPHDFEMKIVEDNWNYYEKRTEHGSSLSACMYALVACKCGMTEEAFPLFTKSATADLAPGGKEWAGLVYIGGTHPASAGGAYMVAVEGFAGVDFKDGKINVNPRLPKNWTKMTFHISYRKTMYRVEIEDNNVTVKDVDDVNSMIA